MTSRRLCVLYLTAIAECVLLEEMKKKRKSSNKATSPKQKATHIHFFYVIAAVWIAGTALAYLLVTSQDTAVLSASTQLVRNNEKGMGKRAERNADGGFVEIGEIDEEGDVQIEIDASGGIEIEDEAGSSGNRGKGKKAERKMQKIRAKIERRASRSASPVKDKKEREGKKNRKEKLLILPRAAVEALLKNGIITAVPISATSSATEDLNVVYTRVKGSPAFILIGSKEEKLFGAIPVAIKKEVAISAENGEVLETKQSLTQRILDLLSF